MVRCTLCLLFLLGALTAAVGSPGCSLAFAVCACLMLVLLAVVQANRAPRCVAGLLLLTLACPAPCGAAEGHLGLGFLWRRNQTPAPLVATVPYNNVTLQSAPACGACAAAVATPAVSLQAVVPGYAVAPAPTYVVAPAYQYAPAYMVAPSYSYAPPAAASISFAPVQLQAPAAPAQAPVLLQQAPAAAVAPDRYWLLRLDGGGTMTVAPVQPR